MALKIGIVGLPNVGKSTIFNALTKTKAAEAQNYPFCTIDPNVGIVEVPDERLHKLAEVSHSQKVIPAAIEFVDIAGLVKGASQGEGLGNKFLANIRECDAIAHVIRNFEDNNISHVHGDINPQSDREVIESELLLADIQTLEKRLDKARTEAKSGDKEKTKYLNLLSNIMSSFQEGRLCIDMDLSEEEQEQVKDLHFLTAKPNLYIVNIHEDAIKDFHRQKQAEVLGLTDIEKIIPICAKLEEDMGEFSTEESRQYLRELGIDDTGLNTLIRSAYHTLGLITYFTSGPKESRAWTIKIGTLAPRAAGVIHTDFEKGFVKAEVIFWEDFVNLGGEAAAKENGKMHLEGKDYFVKDGDVMHFKFSS